MFYKLLFKRKQHAGKHWVLTRKEKIMSKAEGYLIRHLLLGELYEFKPCSFCIRNKMKNGFKNAI